MVRTNMKQSSIKDICNAISKQDLINPGDGIVIASAFQRGDDENGVWPRQMEISYIDSICKNFPTGVIVLVKDYSNAKSYTESWMVLDGGNRCRALRNFLNNKFPNSEKQIFKDLDPDARAGFSEKRLICQELIIERNDPSNTVAEMFSRLNTRVKPLSQGELMKAHGWKGDVQVIEYAKAIIGNSWKTNIDDDDIRRIVLLNVKKNWESVFGKLTSHKRCTTLSLVCAFIVSAVKENFKLFEKSSYNNLHSHFDNDLTENDFNRVCEKISQFLSIMSKVYNADIFGKCTKGMPSKLYISPIWKLVCEGNITPDLHTTIVHFFTSCSNNHSLREKYRTIINKGNDGYASNAKMEAAMQFVKEWGARRRMRENIKV